jgi:hypothetical protein
MQHICMYASSAQNGINTIMYVFNFSPRDANLDFLIKLLLFFVWVLEVLAD